MFTLKFLFNDNHEFLFGTFFVTSVKMSFNGSFTVSCTLAYLLSLSHRYMYTELSTNESTVIKINWIKKKVLELFPWVCYKLLFGTMGIGVTEPEKMFDDRFDLCSRTTDTNISVARGARVS